MAPAALIHVRNQGFCQGFCWGFCCRIGECPTKPGKPHAVTCVAVSLPTLNLARGQVRTVDLKQTHEIHRRLDDLANIGLAGGVDLPVPSKTRSHRNRQSRPEEFLAVYAEAEAFFAKASLGTCLLNEDF